MATNVFIRGLSSRGFRVKTAGAAVPDHQVVDRGQAGVVNAIQVDVDDPGTQRILSREKDNFIRCFDATDTTVEIRGLHRAGFRIKNSGGTWVRVKQGVTATVSVTDGETKRILRRNKRDYIRVPSTTNRFVSIRGLEKGAAETPRGLAFAVRDIGTKAVLVVDAAGANADVTFTARQAGTGGNGISVAFTEDGVAGSETVDVTGKAIVVHTGATSTANQVKTAVDANAAAAQLVTVAVEGSGAGSVDAETAAFATGGSFAGDTRTNVRAGANVTVDPDDPETAMMLRRHSGKWIEVDA